jgi:hypothetical protein
VATLGVLTIECYIPLAFFIWFLWRHCPALEKIVVYPEKIENLSYRVIDEVVDRFRMEIEGRREGEQDGPCPARLKHQLEMTLVKRGFTDDQNKPPPLFEGDICCPYQEIFIVGVGNAGEAFDGTRDHHHPVRPEGAAGDGSIKVLVLVDGGS